MNHQLTVKKFQISKMNITHLSNILANIKLGEEGIKSILNARQYENMLNFGCLDKKQKNAIPAEINEKAGSTATVINTILTGMVGAWLGLYDYIDIKINPLLQLMFVLIAAFLLSFILGSLNYISSTEESRRSIRMQKLKNLQLRLTEIFLKKRKKITKKMICQTNQLLKELYAKTGASKNEVLLLLHYDKKEENNINKIRAQVFKLMNSTLTKKKFLDESMSSELKNYFEYFFKKSTDLSNKNSKYYYPKYFKILSDTELRPDKTSFGLRNWLLKNKQKIFVTFFPALFGAFGSTFVYLGGVPNIFDKIEISNLEYIFDHPVTKIAGLSLAAIITLYLSYSSVKNFYRTYMRDKALKTSDQKIADIELKIIVENKIFSLVNNFYSEIKNIILISHLTQ